MTDEQATPRGAVMQFEIDRKRVAKFPEDEEAIIGKYGKAGWRWRGLLHQAVNDVLANGGTLVIVATPDKVTVVQRPDAEEL